MAPNPSLPNATAALLETEPRPSPRVECPSCHTKDASLTEEALEAGADWRCVRCGQRWDAARLAAVSAYVTWGVEHDRAGRADSRRVAASGHNPPTGPLDGTR